MIARDELPAATLDDTGPALPPLTPGEVLLEEFMRPLGLTARALATELVIPGQPGLLHHQRLTRRHR